MYVRFVVYASALGEGHRHLIRSRTSGVGVGCVLALSVGCVLALSVGGVLALSVGCASS